MRSPFFNSLKIKSKKTIFGQVNSNDRPEKTPVRCNLTGLPQLVLFQFCVHTSYPPDIITEKIHTDPGGKNAMISDHLICFVLA